MLSTVPLRDADVPGVDLMEAGDRGEALGVAALICAFRVKRGVSSLKSRDTGSR